MSNLSGDFFFLSNNSNNNLIRSTPTMNNTQPNQQQQQQPFQFRSPLSGLYTEPPTQIRRLDLIGKRSFNDFHQQQQQPQSTLGFYNRNVKQRSNYQQQYSSPVSTLSPVDFSPIPSLSSDLSTLSSGNPTSVVNSRYGFPIPQQNRPNQSWSLLNQNVAKVSPNFSLPNFTQRNNEFWNNNNNNNNSVAKIPNSSGQVFSGSGQEVMDHRQRLLELEKELLGDDDFPVAENVSVLTDAEWSENLLNNPISPSTPSSCNSTSTSAITPTCPKLAMIDAAIAISDSKPELALDILTRLQNVGNLTGTPEQRLNNYMISALKARVTVNEVSPVADICGSEHLMSTQMLYDVSPCFKLGFMAANLTIIEAANEELLNKIHVVDFDIGKGGQYVHMLHALAASNKEMTLKITVIGSIDDRLNCVGEGLKATAQKVGVSFSFEVKNLLNTSELTRENLQVQSDEALVVNFAFKLFTLPDESVTTENKRDELLRRVKGLSPVVMTVVEQELNGNTAPLVTRVKDACEHYGALFESLDATMGKDNEERVRIEEGMGRKLVNSVACEGRDRVQRCEVFGKWRARMSMAGFQPRVMSQLAADSLRVKLNSVTRGNPGFTVSMEFGGICFGWKARTLTVASAWR